MNEQRRTMFGGSKRSSQMLTMTYSNEVKFLYQVDDEDDSQLLNDDMRFLTGVQQVIKIEHICYAVGRFLYVFVFSNNSNHTFCNGKNK